MEIIEKINFVMTLFENLHISSQIVSNPKKHISSKIDCGLRSMLYDEPNYAKLLLNSPLEAKENIVYRFFDEYMCNYIFFKIPLENDNQYFFVGPYIHNLPTNDFYEKKSQELSLTSNKVHQLKKYYRNIPIITDSSILFNIIDTLCLYVFGENNFSVENVNYQIPDKRRPSNTSNVFEYKEDENKMSLEIIEQNYENEKKLIDAVSKGKLHKLDIFISGIKNQGIEERLEDTIRNRKNYLIILNTLLRKAAELGEVHPFHINKLSSEYARKIENINSIDESSNLQKEMIIKYCILVKEYSLKKYSQLIRRVITLVSYDLTANLTLKNIAQIMNVNASYLSSSFKKECGETLTDYVNRKRMENASFILLHSDKQIQTISEECGIFDVNYFIKLFKKQYGMTPTEFRKISK